MLSIQNQHSSTDPVDISTSVQEPDYTLEVHAVRCTFQPEAFLDNSASGIILGKCIIRPGKITAQAFAVTRTGNEMSYNQESDQLEQDIKDCSATVARVLAETQKRIVGQNHISRRLIMAIIAQGHVLLEGLPGARKDHSHQNPFRGLCS